MEICVLLQQPYKFSHTFNSSLTPPPSPPLPPLPSISGLFLKTPREESLFSPLECPSDVLFTIHSNGRVSRLHVGRLVLRNKALHSGRKTQLVSRTTSRIRRTTSSEKRELEQISEVGGCVLLHTYCRL